jgi:hypothetical protein
MGKRKVCVTARADESANVVAIARGKHAFSTGDDPACDLKARNIALARRRGIDALPLQAIRAIDARCRDLDQDLTGPGLRHQRLTYPNDVRAAMAFEKDLPHHEPDFFAPHRSDPKTIPLRPIS